MKELKTKDPAISRDVAEKELESWFDYRKVRPDLRDKPNSITGEDTSKEAMINGIMYKQLSFDNKEGNLIQTLSFPVTKKDSGDIVLDKLIFKPRLTRLDVLNAGKGLKPNDFDGKQASYLSAATDIGIGTLNKMDESDRGLSDIITGYFLQ